MKIVWAVEGSTLTQFAYIWTVSKFLPVAFHLLPKFIRSNMEILNL